MECKDKTQIFVSHKESVSASYQYFE